ncbi:unnamed protein product [Mytilus edulis]|uniref:Uncharacterized protein n=1 Tax=Mytilus edulis TaxID=6550 RepID=A0A8S3SG96_MYTED|nr:unnamed protein product [Mytilus edulis]
MATECRRCLNSSYNLYHFQPSTGITNRANLLHPSTNHAEVHDQNIDSSYTHSKFCSFDTGTRYFGQGFPSPPKKDHIENTEEFVTSELFDNNLESNNQYQTENTTYKNNWENEESWEQDNQDDITNKQEIIQQNELQIGEIIEISCEHKEKTVETDETENVSVFTRNEQIFETESEDIVENVEIDTQIKENEQMENKNIEAKKKKDKTKVGEKKTEEKTEDKDKTKSSKTTHKKGETHSDKTKKDEPKTDSKTTLANKRPRNSTGDGKKQEHTQKKTKLNDYDEEEKSNNVQLVSDLQIRELNISLDNVQRIDERSSRVIRQELDETKNKLTIAEVKPSKINIKNFVIENTQLHELTKTNDKVQSLTDTTEKMQRQNKRMEEKIDVIIASLGLPSNSVPTRNRSGEITIPNSDRESIPLIGRSSVSNTRIGSAQVAKLPPINKSK